MAVVVITRLDQVTESRLCWPDTKPRSAQRVDGAFKNREAATETRGIEAELGKRAAGHLLDGREHREFPA